MYTDFIDEHTNVARPKTNAIITVRIIKSFTYRTEKSLVLHDLNLLTTTVGQLKDIARQAIQTQSGWKPYRNVQLDTLKVYSQAHGAKTTNLIINLDHDEWILDDDNKSLDECGFENETEVSFFNRELYKQFRANPETSWDP
ncbi:cytoplasmic protein [Moniliophthora roreri MCA 2997]|uniref:Cytoplasmic protein n=1 Tax=Moniliophthora roreri (strain MCA 2997) TaxID=1381753 RepID=V2X7F1_MONRO|nr:cytoplasmic protein [Moniliophthora roreri MCA 2997]